MMRKKSDYGKHFGKSNMTMVNKIGHVLMVKAHVLELIDLGSILAGGFLEGHDFTTRHGRFEGRPP
jgi:hypothetical protein